MNLWWFSLNPVIRALRMGKMILAIIQRRIKGISLLAEDRRQEYEC